MIIFLSFPQETLKSPAITEPPLSHPGYCTPTKSNLYLVNSLAAAVSEPALYSLLTFHVICTKTSVQFRGFLLDFFAI